jgi:hypothetical protein
MTTEHLTNEIADLRKMVARLQAELMIERLRFAVREPNFDAKALAEVVANATKGME